MNDGKWILGQDLSRSDSLLDGFTFEDVITAVGCNCKEVTPDAVRAQVRRMLNEQRIDMNYLMERNMDQIIAAVMESRE